ncbi:MAG: pyridoxamine 5'-phosphate oxidase family protein [bacterium]
MYEFDDDMREFLSGAIALQIGTASNAGKPQVANAWGPRINPDGTLSVFLDTAASGTALTNLTLNGRIALITADPISYRSFQFKGRWLSASQPTPEERAWVQRHRELFTTAMALVGDNPESMRNRWLEETTRIDFTVEHAFDQTPGPNAGAEL